MLADAVGNSLSDLKCKECDKIFKQLSHFNRHTRECHSTARSYTCHCGKSFKRNSHLKRHEISHSRLRSHPCPHCCMAFGYRHHLNRHVNLIHFGILLSCSKCDFTARKKKVISKHYVRAHPSAVAAPSLQQVDTKQKQLLLYKCLQQGCIAAFNRKWELKRHNTTMHSKIQSKKEFDI